MPILNIHITNTHSVTGNHGHSLVTLAGEKELAELKQRGLSRASLARFMNGL